MTNIGKLFIKKDITSSTCEVFICFAQDKYLAFTCQHYDLIVKNVIRLKLASEKAPICKIVEVLPEGVVEGSPLSETSLKQLLEAQKIGI